MSSQPDRPQRHGLPETAGVAARVERLYAEHAGLVVAICRAFLRDAVEAEDATQQTFLSAQRALLNGSEPREPAAWLAAIARNECLGRVRARMRDALPTADDDHGATADTHTVVVAREDAARLRDALAALPAQQREAILLRELRGLSYEEVAASLAVSTSAVESLIFRARRGLQLRLRESAAALSPGEWLSPLRELLSRLAASGLAAPAAAKIVVAGVGTAVVAGGAAVAPTVIGLGRAPVSAPAPPAHRHAVRRRVTATAPPVFVPTVRPRLQPAAPPVVHHVVRREVERETTTGESSHAGSPTSEAGDSHESRTATTSTQEHVTRSHEDGHSQTVAAQAPGESSGGDGSPSQPSATGAPTDTVTTQATPADVALTDTTPTVPTTTETAPTVTTPPEHQDGGDSGGSGGD